MRRKQLQLPLLCVPGILCGMDRLVSQHQCFTICVGMSYPICRLMGYYYHRDHNQGRPKGAGHTDRAPGRAQARWYIIESRTQRRSLSETDRQRII